jgi:hypothetical protein
MNVALNENSAVAVWRRTIHPEAGDLPPEEARAILRLKLSAADQDRADELAEKSRSGTLEPQEEREIETYLSIGSALEFLKSKARLSLQRAGSAA